MEALRRAVIILDCLANSSESGLGVAYLHQATGLSLATVHRFLTALKELRLVEQDARTAKYRLGHKLSELGAKRAAHVGLQAMARPFLLALRDLSEETAGLTVQVDAVSREYVEVAESIHVLRVRLPVGRLFPMGAGAPGRVLVAWLGEAEVERVMHALAAAAYPQGSGFDPEHLRSRLVATRRAGYASAVDDYEPGTATLAAPVRNPRGSVIAAISVSGPSMRFTKQRRELVLPHLLQAAAELSASLGYVEELPTAVPLSTPSSM